MITPRRTRLLRAADLFGFRRAIAALAADGGLVLVPSRAAARQLARLIDAGRNPEPLLVTREEMYDVMRRRLPAPPVWLTEVERDAIAQAAARRAAGGARRLRPGLVAEMLRFYDLLRRQSQSVQRFEELIAERLEPQLEIDPGAQRMLEQTRFLAATFREYEQAARASGKCDEHLLREQLIAEPASEPVTHVVVTVPDWIADPDGLFVADFDLLSRVPDLERLDIVATDGILGSGFHERLHTWWPGLDEEPATGLHTDAASRKPFLSTPDADRLWTIVRDRQEELIDVARRIAADRPGRPDARAAVVYKRPLPYVYLAPEAFGAAEIAFETADALPLAAEPVAAALDLVLELVANGFTRADVVALLRSPHFAIEANGRRPSPREIAALDRELSDRRYLGELERLRELVPSLRADGKVAGDAILAIAADLVPLTAADRASVQTERLAAAFSRLLRPLDDGDRFAARERRAREMLLGGLRLLSFAHAAHDDPSWTADDLAAAVRRWIENQTMETVGSETVVPDTRVVLLDDRAARYGEFDDMTIVGLVEGDWPERSRRNIFFGSSLMTALGWPSERDRRAAAETRFLDLIASPSHSVALSTITLEDEAIVERSSLLDEVARARLSAVVRGLQEPERVYAEEWLSIEPVETGRLAPAAAAWVALRQARSTGDLATYHGQTEPPPPHAWSVSAIETYLGCPFRFFAQYVLRLEEDPEDEEVMDPRDQGEFVHQVFEQFFREWQASGRGAVTPENLDAARALFARTVDTAATMLPDSEAGLERTRLLGSPAAAGLGEAVLRMEAERPIGVVERLLERRFEGEFRIRTEAGPRDIAIRGKADRIDLLADGTFRLIDYKLGWPPDKRRALQLPVYSLCAEQQLDGRHGRQWRIGEAVYLAFKGPRRVVPLFAGTDSRDEVLASAQQRLSDALDAIGGGQFPPTPDDVHRCETCTFAAVCRKDYVGDV